MYKVFLEDWHKQMQMCLTTVVLDSLCQNKIKNFMDLSLVIRRLQKLKINLHILLCFSNFVSSFTHTQKKCKTKAKIFFEVFASEVICS